MCEWNQTCVCGTKTHLESPLGETLLFCGGCRRIIYDGLKWPTDEVFWSWARMELLK